jgi:putative glycosyltransferase (TIGR04348 family)
MRADADALYDSAKVAHDTRWSLPLPSRNATINYLEAVRDQVLDRLASSSLDAHNEYFILLSIFHEDMHDEAFHHHPPDTWISGAHVLGKSANPHGLPELLHSGSPGHLGRVPNLRVGIVKTLIVTPEAPGTTLGNSITADRWSGMLGKLGHEVQIEKKWTGENCDLLIALHARRSHDSIERFHEAHSQRPLIVALTGTDLYGDLRVVPEARHSLVLATRIVALQEAARDELDHAARAKTRIIYQSAIPPKRREHPREDCFEVCVLSHLRDVKDPLRAALAARCLPAQSHICVTHAGRALESKWEDSARAEELANPRYRWIGEQTHEAAMQLLARSRVLVLSSMMEGGASAIAEAVVCGVPVLCSDIPGNIGMLGRGYAGYFRLENTDQLADLLDRAERDPDFLAGLQEFIRKLQPRFAPEEELASWDRLLRELALTAS